MDCQKVGELILQLRKERNMTQKQLADTMNISDKTVSKWERGLGCPDVSLLPELSQVLNINIEKILSGVLDPNDSVGGNMKKISFFVCRTCGNVITSTGETSVSCCGRKLEPFTALKADDHHQMKTEIIDNDWYISSRHEMTKNHFISFVAYVTGDKLLMIKKYPEWDLDVRMQKLDHGMLYSYCTEHGLFYQLI